MNVVVTVEHRFDRLPDGSVWTSGMNSCRLWARYRTVFETVKVVARVRDVLSVPPGWSRANGPGITFLAVPYYLGPWQYLAKAWQVHRALGQAMTDRDAIILRVGSHIAGCLEPALFRAGHPYGLEVVSDPFDVFAPGAVRHRLRPFFRWWFTRQLRRQCRRAAGVAYVTRQALQARYPCATYSVGMSDVEISPEALVRTATAFATHYSSVELATEASVTRCRSVSRQGERFRLITIASLAQMYKAPDILIRAVGACVTAGLDLSLTIVGDGQHRPELERLAFSLGLRERIRFLGQLPAGVAVRAQLDAADLFVLPSRSEGLPRAMIEAMARALPCLGSTVGGIPELLPPEDLVPASNVAALAAKIREVLASPNRLSAMSSRNLAAAREYRDEVLDARRRAFFEHIRDVTAEWLTSPSRAAVFPSPAASGI
jgi:glycosyltransferase involved in cell wall biosynthesis